MKSENSVQGEIVKKIQHGLEEEKVIEDEEIGELDLSYRDLNSHNRHEVVFHGCDFSEGIDLSYVDIHFPLSFVDCDIGGIDLGQAQFEYDLKLEGCGFTDEIQANETRFNRDFDFVRCKSTAPVVMEECDFGDDARFKNSSFEDVARFDGAEFSGVSNSLGDHVTFEGSSFEGEASFYRTTFRSSAFWDADFKERATFEKASFENDADFSGVVFHKEADFDETRFVNNGDFSEAVFKSTANFRGSDFTGGTNYEQANAVFENVVFEMDAQFDNSSFSSANFLRTEFGGVIDFTNSEFLGEFTFLTGGTSDENHIDFTDATLKEGTLIQPEDNRVRFNFTNASLGEVSFEAENGGRHLHLLDYVLINRTQFDEFDGYEFNFDEYTNYLDRHQWDLHRFSVEGEGEFELTPEELESTYIKAKQAASSGGYKTAAGEFRIKRQQAARRKYLKIARDKVEGPRTRIGSVWRAIENYFMGVTCGHGIRFARVFVVFGLFPLLPGLLFAYGGAFMTTAGSVDSFAQMVTPEGLSIIGKNVFFSYVSFTSIGYGNIGATGALGRALAIFDGFAQVILGGLVLYALAKRSEI